VSTYLQPWPKRVQPRAPLPANIADLVAQYMAGASAKHIAALMQRDTTIALQTLRRAGATIRQSGRPAGDVGAAYAVHRDAILRDYADRAVLVATISTRYGISLESLYRLVDGAGLPRRVPACRGPKLQRGPLTEDQRRARTETLSQHEARMVASLPRRCGRCLAVTPGVETCGMCGGAR
jgi:hypothetical protein